MRQRRGSNQQSVFYPIFRTLSIVVIVTAFLVPIAWMILASIKSNIDLYDTAKFLVFKPTLENYKTVFEDQDFFAYFVNSLVVGVASTALSLVIAVPAAYSVARFAMRRSANAVLLARVIPSISLIVPWYFIFARLDLVGGYGAVVLAHMFTSVPLALWIMMSYFEALPTELEEAGQIDGLTAIGAFLRVTLPLSTPGVATAAILAFIFSWNNFLFSLVLTGSSTRTLPVAIMNFIGYASIDWGGLMAASTAITVPIMVIAIFFQKYVVSGLTAGAQKG